MAFQKGKSGNPGGRPKDAHDVKQLARKHSREALERLVEWMHSDNPKASVSACQAILDRGYGKPTQLLGGDPDSPPVQIEKIERVVIRAHPETTDR